MSIAIAIHGAAGRMGEAILRLASEDPRLESEFEIVAALEQAGHKLIGQNVRTMHRLAPANLYYAADLALGGMAHRQPDVLIDFSHPSSLGRLLQTGQQLGCALVIGTTGLGPADQAAIDAAARKVAVLQAPNMSLGVNLLFALAAQVAKQLGDEYDIEIVETHHRFKKDAPSGTALGIAQAICAATGKSMEQDVVHGRHGDNVPRRPGQIGMHALRLGDVIGEHTVSYGALGERLELTHRATTRDVLARGALRAAGWLAGKPVGRYSMKDVLGL